MLKMVGIGAAGTAALGAALGLAASRVTPELDRRHAAKHAVDEAKPLLQRLSLDVPDLARAPVDTGPGTAEPAQAVGASYAPSPFVAAARTPDDAARALECLTEAVYHEARSEGADGQRAVAQVVLNRVRDRAFPSSVCGVVYQGSNRATGCQFTFTCDGSLRRPRRPEAWARAEAVAQAALNGEVYAPVGSATHYHANYVSPWWAPSLSRIGAVGAHVFYRWRGALERALTFRQTYAGWEPGAPRVAPAQGFPESGTPWGAPAAAVARVALDDGLVVRVHRGSAEMAAMSAPATAHGVRVHRRSTAAEATAGAAGAVQAVEGALIGAESDPV